MGYGPRRYRYSRRQYASSRANNHIEQARAFSEEVGHADEEVKQAFFSLSGSDLDHLLEEYGDLHGEAAREYARDTIPKWRARTVTMSGMVAQRLFTLLPPFMHAEQKYRLVEAIWKRYGARSRKYVYLGPNCDPEAVVADIDAYFDRLDVLHLIPETLKRRFDWLSENDAAAKEQLLNHFMHQQRRAAVLSAGLNIPLMLSSMQTDSEGHIRKLNHTVFVGNHHVEIKADPLRSGFLLSDSPNDLTRRPSPFNACSTLVALAAVVLGVSWVLSSMLRNTDASAPTQFIGSSAQKTHFSQTTMARTAPSEHVSSTRQTVASAVVIRNQPRTATTSPPATAPAVLRHAPAAPLPNRSAVETSRGLQSVDLSAERPCADTVIIRVEDGGVSLQTGDGRSFSISTAGLTRYTAARWSTGDIVNICAAVAKSGLAYASISNRSRYDKVAGTLVSTGSPSQVTCDKLRLVRVADSGSTLEATDGSRYQVSQSGLMRYAAARWSTGDPVRVCRARAADGAVAASVENATYYDKVQAALTFQGKSAGIRCWETRIASVRDSGSRVATADGASYVVSESGLMQYAAQAWSTGELVTVCESRAADGSVPASISNTAHYDKVQATRS